MPTLIILFLAACLGAAFVARLQGKIEAMMACVGGSVFALVIIIFAL